MQVIRHGIDVSADYGPDELEAIKLGYEAFDGEVGQGSIPVPDPTGSQESYAGESLRLVDGAVTIFDGWVGNQDRTRGTGAVPPRRLATHTLGDGNACLHGHATPGWSRPSELPHERWAAFLDDFVDPALGAPLDRTWLLATNEGTSLKAKTYRTDDLFNELLTDTQEKTGKTVFVVNREFHWHLATEGEILDVAISDTAYDEDNGWPPLAPTILRSKDQMDLRTHIWGRNSRGTVVEASDATAISRHDADGLVHHGFMEFSDESESEMQSAVNIALAESRTERITYECDLGPMDAAHVARFKPGGLLNCTSQVWGLSNSTQRIARLDLAYIHPGRYKVHVELGYPIRKRRKPPRTVSPAPSLPPYRCSPTTSTFDNFDRAVSPDSWGTASGGQAWTRGGASNGHSHVDLFSGDGAGHLDNGAAVGAGVASVETQETDFGTGGGDFTFVMRCYVSNDGPSCISLIVNCGGIAFGWHNNNNAAHSYLILDDSNGGATTTFFPDNFWSTLSGTWAVMKCERFGAQVRLKLWDEADAEPAWQLTASLTPGPLTQDLISFTAQNTTDAGGTVSAQIEDINIATTACAPPAAGQQVTDEAPQETPDGSTSTFTTQFPYVPGSLRVKVDGIYQTVTEADPTTGAYALSWTPATGDQIIEEYQAA